MNQRPVVDAVIPGDHEATSHPGRQRRLERARLARPQPCHLEAELGLKDGQFLEARQVVAVTRDADGALGAVPGVDAAGLLDLGRRSAAQRSRAASVSVSSASSP